MGLSTPYNYDELNSSLSIRTIWVFLCSFFIPTDAGICTIPLYSVDTITVGYDLWIYDFGLRLWYHDHDRNYYPLAFRKCDNHQLVILLNVKCQIVAISTFTDKINFMLS